MQKESDTDGEIVNDHAEEYSEQKKNQTEAIEEIIMLDPEEYEEHLEPLYDPEEIDFIRDMEELGRMLKESEESQGVSEEELKEYDYTGFKAEEYFRTLKEKEQDIKYEEEIQRTNENEEELIEEPVENEYKEILSDNEPEEEPENYPKEVESPYEAEYFMNAEEDLHEKGKSSEEISEEMHQVENSYELNEEVDKAYEQQVIKKIESVDHSDEEEGDEIEEIDRVDVLEHAVDKEEELQQQGMPQEEIDHKIEGSINEFYQKEKEEYHQKEQEKELKKDVILEQAIPENKSSDGQKNEEITQTSLYDNKNAIEPHTKTDEHQEIHETTLESEDNRELSEGEKFKTIRDVEKPKKADLDIEEHEEFQQLYREETGKRPIYAGKNTKGFCQWLEQYKMKKEEITEQKEKEQVTEKWKRILREWIKESKEELLNSELKLILTELLQNAEALEDLHKKCASRKIAEKGRSKWKTFLHTLQIKYPIRLELYCNIHAFKEYIQDAHPWDVPRKKFKFLHHLAKKYKILKEIQEIIKEIKNFSNMQSLRFQSRTRLIICKRIYELIISNYSKDDVLINLIHGLIRGSIWTSDISYKELKNLTKKIKNPKFRNSIIRYFYELIEIVLTIHNFSQSDEKLNMKSLSENLIKKGYNLRLKVDSLRFFIKDLVEFLKNEFDKLEVNKIEKQVLLDNGKYKQCAICHKLKLHSDYIKRTYGGLESVCKNCKQEKEAIRRELNKLDIIKEINQFNFVGKCQKCKTDISKLPALDFHHPTSHKTISWRKLRHSNYINALKRLEKDGVEILCANCHSKEQASTFNRFKHIILKSDLFKFSAKKIRILILNTVKEICPKKTPEARSKIKYNIMIWIKKRYIIEQIYEGGCITCGKVTVFNNLPSLIFHHLETNKKEKNVWRTIQTKSIKDIITILREEKCICVCSNCHRLLHTPYFVSDIINHLGTEKRIKAISFFESMKKRINNFKFREDTFKDPLKLKYKYGRKWQEYLAIIYKYCQNKNDFHFSSLDLKKILKVGIHAINNNLKILLNQKLIEISREKKPLKEGKLIVGQIPRLYTLTPLGIKSAQDSL